MSLRTVERAVMHLRQGLRAEARATVRFETRPGEQLQIDFGQRRVAIDGAPRLVSLFCAVERRDLRFRNRRQEERLATTTALRPDTLGSEEKDRLMELGTDLETTWSHPGATAETRKRILRAVLEEIVATLTEARIELVINYGAVATTPASPCRATKPASIAGVAMPTCAT